jgi:hypothetical protein
MPLVVLAGLVMPITVNDAQSTDRKEPDMDKPTLLTYATARGIATALLDKVVELGDDDVLCAAVSNPTLPAPSLEQLSHHDSGRVRAATIGSGRLDTGRVQDMALDEDEKVRAAVAESAQAEPLTVEQLASDSSTLVRAAAVANTLLSLETLHTRRTDNDETVRAAAQEAALGRGVATATTGGSALYELLSTLHGPESGDLDGAQLADTDRTQALVGDVEDARRALAQRDDVTEEEQTALAVDESSLVRMAVAGNPKIGVDASKVLASDAEVTVRAVLAQVTLHPEIHDLLSADQEPLVRSSIAERADISEAVVVKLAGDTTTAVSRTAVVNHPTVAARLDNVAVPELLKLGVASWPARLLELCGNAEAFASAQTMAPSFPGTLGALAAMSRAMTGTV